MASNQKIREEIKQLEEILATGATNVNVDGVNVTFNPREIQKRIKELESKLPGKRRRGGAYGITGLGN